MPDYIKISELPAASSAAATDQIEANQAGTSRSITVSQLNLASNVLQTVLFQTGTQNTGTTIMPDDNTIPQITEGTQFMQLAITPKSATSKLVVTVSALLACNTAGLDITAALFRDAVASALAGTVAFCSTANTYAHLTFIHTMTSGGTSAITFRFRAGPSAAATVVFNGILGGVAASSIVIQEVAP